MSALHARGRAPRPGSPDESIRDDQPQQTSAEKLWWASMEARLAGREREADELAYLSRLYDQADQICRELRKLQGLAEAA